jgi:hypothetical protein
MTVGTYVFGIRSSCFYIQMESGQLANPVVHRKLY